MGPIGGPRRPGRMDKEHDEPDPGDEEEPRIPCARHIRCGRKPARPRVLLVVLRQNPQRPEDRNRNGEHHHVEPEPAEAMDLLDCQRSQRLVGVGRDDVWSPLHPLGSRGFSTGTRTTSFPSGLAPGRADMPSGRGAARIQADSSAQPSREHRYRLRKRLPRTTPRRTPLRGAAATTARAAGIQEWPGIAAAVPWLGTPRRRVHAL